MFENSETPGEAQNEENKIPSNEISLIYIFFNDKNFQNRYNRLVTWDYNEHNEKWGKEFKSILETYVFMRGMTRSRIQINIALSIHFKDTILNFEKLKKLITNSSGNNANGFPGALGISYTVFNKDWPDHIEEEWNNSDEDNKKKVRNNFRFFSFMKFLLEKNFKELREQYPVRMRNL